MNFSTAKGIPQERGTHSSIPDSIRDSAISILKRPDVLNSILVLIGDDNLLPKGAMSNSRPDPFGDVTLQSVQKELKGLKKLSQMLIRPFKNHNIATITLIWTLIGIFLLYANTLIQLTAS
jgi:hypothetical protein